MLTIECKKSGLSCDISYGAFSEFRTDIAFLCDKEYGEHYNKLSSTIFHTSDTEDDLKVWEDQFEVIRKKYKISPRIHNFLLSPDCDEKLTNAGCRELLFLVQKLPDKRYGNGVRYCSKNQIELVLLQCIATNSTLVWY